MNAPQPGPRPKHGQGHHRLAQAVREQSSGHYFWLFFALLTYMCVEPLLAFPMHIQITSVLIFIAAMRASGGGLLGRWGTLALAAVYTATAAAAVVTGAHWLAVSAGVIFGILVLALVIDGLGYVVGRSEVEADHIFAAICVYLEMAFLFAVIYWIIWTLDPTAFTGVGLPTDPHPRELGYYSFMTLTTTGIGDILPASRLARLFTTLEALTGTLYLALMIARLVGMYSQRPHRSAEPRG